MKLFLSLITSITRPFFLFPIYLHQLKRYGVRLTRQTVLASRMGAKMLQIAFLEFVVLLLPK
jgi:hypothetical protein